MFRGELRREGGILAPARPRSFLVIPPRRSSLSKLIAAATAMVPLFGSSFAGYKIAQSHRTILSGVQLALEQILDRLEHGDFEKSPGLLGALSSRARLPRG